MSDACSHLFQQHLCTWPSRVRNSSPPQLPLLTPVFVLDIPALKVLIQLMIPRQVPVAIYLQTEVAKVPFITPLLCAIKQGAPDEVIQTLIELGDDIDAIDVSGRTPFMTAAKAGRLDLILNQTHQKPKLDAGMLN